MDSPRAYRAGIEIKGMRWVLVVIAGLLLKADPASAASGQCLWENGPGAPTYAYCALEDCIEQGGLAQCTEPEIRPIVSRNESQTDNDDFIYGMCDRGPPHPAKDAKWCTSEGGTWLGPGPGGCVGLPAEYPGVAVARTEGAAVAASDAWVTTSSCAISSIQDSNWGFNNVADSFCLSGTTVTRNGKIIWDIKRRQYETTCGPAGEIMIVRQRDLKCLNPYTARTKPNGDLHCYIPATGMCPINNPVCGPTGGKVHQETDYRVAGPATIELRRLYNSQGYFRPPGSGAAPAQASDFWRTSYDRQIYRVTASANAIAVLRLEDGTARHFDGSGYEVLNRNGAGDRLEDLGSAGWRLVKANADVELYDAAGLLSSITTRDGLTTSITRDGNGRIDTVQDSFGRALDFDYGALGELAAVILPGGSQIIYDYDERRRLVSVMYPDSTTRGYHYEHASNSFLLTGITDENNQRFATYTYEQGGLITGTAHAGGVEVFTYQYQGLNTAQTTTVVTDPLGRSRSYVQSNVRGVFKLKSNNTYCDGCPNQLDATFDANGNISSRRDLNNRRTNYVYDLVRNLETSRTEGLTSSGAATPVTRTTTTSWHPTLRLPELLAVYAGSSTASPLLRTTATTYDAQGRVLTVTVSDPSTTPAVTRTWTYTYDSYGRVFTEDGPRTDVADVTAYTYYSCASGSECGQVHTITNALNQVTTFASYSAHGQPLTIIDPNGSVTTLTYDARQRLISRQVGVETITFEYWPTGLLKKVTQPDQSYLLHTYDAAHRLTRIEDGAGNRIEYTLDPAGNRTAESVYDPLGALVRTRSRVFNNLGQLWKVLAASGTAAQTTVFGYDSQGNQNAVNAPLGRTTSLAYDELNRLRQETDPALGNTYFSYDALDNLRQVTDPRNLVTTYEHNGLGDLKRQTSPDTGITTNTFDSGGNLHTSVDARGATATHSHDALNRVTSTSFSIGGVTDQVISYTYDSGVNGKGRPSSVSDADSALAWTYDEQGRVLSKTQTVGSFVRSVVYDYSQGRLASLTTPSGQSVTYGYDAFGRIASVQVNGAWLVSNVRHDPFGPISGWTWGNGSSTVRSFDLDGRLERVDSAGRSTYSFNDDGSIASRIDDNWMSYATAHVGTTNMAFSPASNRVTASTGALARSYGYDGAGNVTSVGGTTFVYSAGNRLRSSTQGGVTTNYVINPLGQRVQKSSISGTTRFIYDEAGRLLGEYSASGALVQETVWLGDIPIATLRPDGSGGVAIFYVHTDHLNTPRRVTRPIDNVVVWRWASDPFGAAPADENPDGDADQFVYGLRFPGQYFDAESGLHYNYYRDYDPTTGRYIQSDPIGLEGGLNTYAYVSGNPISFIDPLGLQTPAICANPANWAACEAASVGAEAGSRSSARAAAAAAAAAATATRSSDCCTEYKLVYEPSPKHRAQRYFSRGVSVARAPTNGQLTLSTSIPTGSSSERRVGYDVPFKELVVFPLTRTDEVNCIKYYHGWVADYFDDIYGRDDILRAIRSAGYPMP